MMAFWDGYVSDEAMGTFAPIVVYWVYAGFYQLLPPMDNYRLHTRKEEDEKNSVRLAAVVRGVLLQQLVQATVAQGLFLVSGWLISPFALCSMSFTSITVAIFFLFDGGILNLLIVSKSDRTKKCLSCPKSKLGLTIAALIREKQ